MIAIPKGAEHHVQGDLILFKLPEMPSVVISEQRAGIVQEGEATGHSHRLKSNSQVLLLDPHIASNGEHAILQLEKPDELVHEEHGKIKLEAGVWLVGRQRTLNSTVSD
jgi:hypothetical protein